jgi:hypothetical protein
MKYAGIIQKGVKIKEDVSYYCKKCGKPVELAFHIGMEESTHDIFKKLMVEEKCLDCYCEGKIPEVAECLVN